MSGHSLQIGTESSFVRLSFPQLPNGPWDGMFTAEVLDGRFSGQADCWDHPASEHGLPVFARELSVLHKTLKGRATFNPLEGQIKLVLSADAFGHIDVSGYLYETARRRTHLNFEFQIDQTYLARSLAQLKQLGLA